MNEKKNFFTKNSLNKGIAVKNINITKQINYKSLIKDPSNISIPPIEVIAEYEEFYPGIVKKIIDMAENEQHHTHILESEKLKHEQNLLNFSKKSSIFIFTFLVLTLITLYLTDKSSDITKWIVLSALSVVTIYIGSIMLYVSKRVKNTKERYKNFTVDKTKNKSNKDNKNSNTKRFSKHQDKTYNKSQRSSNHTNIKNNIVRKRIDK